ncbi:MAG: putative Sensor histidine kinase [Nitrospira sp.]|jgi:CheY-like chemotaxis protein|nr:putative Sensor histidine kinase [Nitrospira sp.]
MQGTSVKNGTDALTLLRGAAAEGRPFDLVILEERLSGGEGAQLAQSMKGDPDLGSIPVIVVTAFGQRGDARAAQEAGVAAYLTRPIHQSALWRCLATLLQATPDHPAGRKGMARSLMTRHSLQEQADRERARVLVVDDQELNQVVAVSLLERLGCLVDVAGSGQAAVAAVSSTPYDLVFIDCQMSDLDGFQVTTMMRQTEGPGARVPIVAMTGLAQAGDREKCLAAGMNDYLAKPLQFHLLEATVRRWVKKDFDKRP